MRQGQVLRDHGEYKTGMVGIHVDQEGPLLCPRSSEEEDINTRRLGRKPLAQLG